jgi:hypothetical protein
MTNWQAFGDGLKFRRLDVTSSAGELEAIAQPTVLRVRGRLLVALSASTGLPRAIAERELEAIADELVAHRDEDTPAALLRALREDVWQKFEAGRFDRALPEIMAVAGDAAGPLRVWRAGPNGVAVIGDGGARLASEDLRFAALQRAGATLEPRWLEQPLLSEVSELTQLESAHAKHQELSVDARPACLLLLSRGALPFGAPASVEALSTWWARDAGWRHGMGATLIAIAADEGAGADCADGDSAKSGARAQGDNALATFSAAVALVRLPSVLVSASPAERSVIAGRLAREGSTGWRLLAALGGDASQPAEVRLAAASAMTDEMPRELLEAVASALLQGSDPRLRGHGIILSARHYLTALAPLLEPEFDSQATFTEQGRDVSLANLARAAARALRAYRPDPSFPDWSEVAADAPRPSLEHPAEDAGISPEYAAIRQFLLGMAPEEIGLSRARLGRRAFGVLMETGYAQGTHTLACLSNGTVHNHLSNGMLDQSMSHHDAVRAAAAAFLARAEIDHDAASPTRQFPRPAPGRVRFYFLGAYEIRAYEAEQRSLLDHSDPFSQLYHAGHAVLSEIHAIELGLE